MSVNLNDKIKIYINEITNFINNNISSLKQIILPNNKIIEQENNLVSIKNNLVSIKNNLVGIKNNLVSIEDIIIYFTISLFTIYYFLNTNIKLPLFIIKLFENKLFKLIVILYILYVSKYNFSFAIFITFNFLLIIYLKNKQIVNELLTDSLCSKCRNNKCKCSNKTII